MPARPVSVPQTVQRPTAAPVVRMHAAPVVAAPVVRMHAAPVAPAPNPEPVVMGRTYPRGIVGSR